MDTSKGDKTKVLCNTSVGRRNKLSLYQSKAAMKRKSEESAQEASKVKITPHYTKIIKAMKDKEINVLDDESDIESDKTSNCDSGESLHVEVSSGESFEVADNSESTEEPFFKAKCIERLKDENLLRNLVDNLHAEGNLEDFVHLMEQLANGKLPCNNIVLLLLLDRVHFQRCCNTVGMQYRKVTKLFWSIAYRLCKGVGLKFFGGSKNWGQVVAKESMKIKYEPHMSKINFAVPDEKVLRDLNYIMPKLIPPGKIRCTMEMIKDKEDIILMGDTKLVTKGLKKDFSSDVNLFGHEINPNLDDLKKYMDRRIVFLSDCIEKYG